MIKNKYFHGAKISSYGISEGFLDYQCMAEMAQAEFIDIYSEEYEDACWELYNGEDCYYYDSDGHTYIGGLNTMKKLINGERYNQEIAMHTGYHLQITATEAAYLVSGGRYFTRTDDLEYRGRVMQHPGMRDYLASELKK